MQDRGSPTLWLLAGLVGWPGDGTVEDSTYKPPSIRTGPTAIFCWRDTRRGYSSQNGMSRRTMSVMELRHAATRN